MSSVNPETNDEWEVKSAADTLMQAERIKKDSKLMKKVRIQLKKRLSELQAAQKIS